VHDLARRNGEGRKRLGIGRHDPALLVCSTGSMQASHSSCNTVPIFETPDDRTVQGSSPCQSPVHAVRLSTHVGNGRKGAATDRGDVARRWVAGCRSAIRHWVACCWPSTPNRSSPRQLPMRRAPRSRFPAVG
jgi:hypothetical protein